MRSHRFVYPTNQKGFTLIEIAIVMVIIGILAGGGISMVKVLTDRKARNESVAYLHLARSTLISFMSNNGRLPWADSDGDGIENNGTTRGTLPYLTLQIIPADAYNRSLRYEVNAGLTVDRATSCAVLKAGLSIRPLMVDAGGVGTAFAVAAALVSAGPMDADSNGNVFDRLTSGTHQGNNVNGNPNYLRNPPVTGFDDLTAYIGGNVLFGEVCEYLNLAVNNTSGATVYVHDINQGTDIGVIANNNSGLYNIISGTRIGIYNGPNATGGIVSSTPPTPIILAGQGATINLP